MQCTLNVPQNRCREASGAGGGSTSTNYQLHLVVPSVGAIDDEVVGLLLGGLGRALPQLTTAVVHRDFSDEAGVRASHAANGQTEQRANGAASGCERTSGQRCCIRLSSRAGTSHLAPDRGPGQLAGSGGGATETEVLPSPSCACHPGTDAMLICVVSSQLYEIISERIHQRRGM